MGYQGEAESEKLFPSTRETAKYSGAASPKEVRDQIQDKFGTSVWHDICTLREGSIPQSVVAAVLIATACGVGGWLYYVAMEWGLEFFWHTLPEKIGLEEWDATAQVLWLPIVGFTMALGLGLSVVALGDPGDLPYTIQCVHDEGFVHLNHVAPMVVSSLFSIIGGGSVGPEAPLVAICAAIGGNISVYVLKQTNRSVMRKHTLMGMGGALSAFFGCPLGGSLFALEICSKFGLEYFEHMMETVFCGLLCTCVFRTLTGLPIGPMWDIGLEHLGDQTPATLGLGAAVGLLGSFVGYIFMVFHWKVMAAFQSRNLIEDTNNAVWRAFLGAIVFISIGMFIPHTMFWGEAEFQTMWTLSPSSTLEHVYPTTSLTGFEMDNFWKCLLVGFSKLVTISFSVAGGYRGGFIFPLFSAGAAFGRAMVFLFPTVSPAICCLSFAAGINVAVTKTAMSTTLILSYLAGEQNAFSPILAASLTSLFVTAYMPFIKTQMSREDELGDQLSEHQHHGKKKRMSTRRSMVVNHIAGNDTAVNFADTNPSVQPSLTHHASRSYLV